MRTDWPLLGDVAVVGRAVHGRRSDTDVVICGPGGRYPTDVEMAKVRGVLAAPEVAPEAVSLVMRKANRREFSVLLAIAIPPGRTPRSSAWMLKRGCAPPPQRER